MKYNFDETVVRKGTGCYKWDEEPQPDIIPLWVADMDFKAAPPILQAMQQRLQHGVFGYTLVGQDYYRSVVSWFERRHNWRIDPSWITYTTGVVPALSCVIKALTMPGEQVILQTPVYNCFFSSVKNNGCEVVENPLLRDSEGRYTIDYDHLQALAAQPKARLLVLCNPHNPVGRVWTKDELQRVNDICRANDVIVVSDEIHNELVFGPRRYQPFAAIGPDCLENGIILTSPSKSFNIAGLQMANIICSNDTWRRRIDRAININEVCDVNSFAPVASAAAYDHGEQWIDQLCQYLWQNYEALTAFMAQHLPLLRVTPLEGTYLVWVDISATGLTSNQLTQLLLDKAHVQVNSGTMYGRQTGEGFIRINIACPRSQLMEGLRRMAQVLH